jgi:hypothetical protein
MVKQKRRLVNSAEDSLILNAICAFCKLERKNTPFHLNLREVDECRQSKIQNTTSCGKLIKKVDQKNEMVPKVMAE